MQITRRLIAVRASLYVAVGSWLMCWPALAQNETATDNAVTGNPPETPEVVRGSQQNPTPVEVSAQAEAKDETPVTSLSVGGDLYYGRSDLEGFKSLRDGFWAAGAGPSFPSVVQLRLNTRADSEAKLAFGIGRLYTDSESTLDQPHEAWYRIPTRGLNLTIGKYYVPFALQEWQYETKWGVMLEGESGATNWAASTNYNHNTDRPNIYGRVGRNFGKKLNVGLSLGAGKGLSYDSIHDKALGLDATASRNGWNLYGEYMALRRRSDERFDFGWLKLEYDKLGKFKPFVAHWRWRDTTDTFGNFRSSGIGASYSILPQLAIEGGLARTSEQNVKWIQLHWTPDWKLWTKENRNSNSDNTAQNALRVPQQLLPQKRP